MFTRYGLELLKQKIADRDDSNALHSACGEYNCDCHELVPKLLVDLLLLHERVAQVQKAIGHLPVTLPKGGTYDGHNTTTPEE